MKRNFIKTVCAILLMALVMSLVACGKDNVYDTLGEEGYTVKVRYDVGEHGLVNETQNVSIVEVFSAEDVITTAAGKTGVSLLAPEDPARGADGAFKISCSRDGVLYFSAGWYTGRTEVAGGYTYSGRWDFDRDVVDPAALENGEMTLYAAWIPSFTYEFYSKNDAGEFELIGSKRKIDLLLPEWNERTEKWRMRDLPEVTGKVFEAAYLDENLTQPVTAAMIDGDGTYVDYEKGVATTPVIKLYITWTEAAA